MRLFFGIYPDSEVLKYCRDAYRLFDKEKNNLKSYPNDQLYINIRFIGGRVSDGSKNAIIDALRAQHGNLPKPVIKITKLQFGFSHQHDPRILFASVQPNDELLQLQDVINKVMRKLDFEDTITWKQHKQKEFHISIARLKPAATRSTGRKVKEILEAGELQLPKPFIANEISAVQSIIDNRGKPKYRTLERIEL